MRVRVCVGGRDGYQTPLIFNTQRDSAGGCGLSVNVSRLSMMMEGDFWGIWWRVWDQLGCYAVCKSAVCKKKNPPQYCSSWKAAGRWCHHWAPAKDTLTKTRHYSVCLLIHSNPLSPSFRGKHTHFCCTQSAAFCFSYMQITHLHTTKAQLQETPERETDRQTDPHTETES